MFRTCLGRVILMSLGPLLFAYGRRPQNSEHSSPQVLICVTGPEDDQRLVCKPVLTWGYCRVDMLAHGASLLMLNGNFHIHDSHISLWTQTCGYQNLSALQCLTRASLLGAEPCVDLWPPIEHRRVRNERTGRGDCKTVLGRVAGFESSGLFCAGNVR